MTRIHGNSATSSGQRRGSIRCYARTTRRAPLRKRCGALASRRSTRRTWRSSGANVRRQRRGADDVWRNCSSNGRRRLTYHRARGACARRKSRASQTAGASTGVHRGVATPGPGGRWPRRGGCCQRPRRDVLRSQENNRRRKDADVSYEVSRRASLRREIVPGEQEPSGAGRRRDARGLFIDEGSPPSVTRGMEIDWNAPVARTRAQRDECVRSRWSSRIAHQYHSKRRM